MYIRLAVEERVKCNIIENHYPIGLRNRKTKSLVFDKSKVKYIKEKLNDF